MKTFIYFICTICMFVMLTSCNDWLDVSPKANVKAEDLFADENGYRDVLAGVYQLIRTKGCYGTEQTFGFTDVLAQYYNTISGNTTHEYYPAYLYDYTDSKVESTLSTIWTNNYKAISNLNAILLFIDDTKGVFSSDAIYRVYKGEALGLRAMLHFDLLRLFGPNPVTGMDEKAIPYMSSYTNVAQKFLTTHEVLQRIIKDIEDARELMRDVDPYGPNYSDLIEQYDDLLGTRVYHLNYLATTALLARVYLYDGNKGKALMAVQEIIGQPNDSPVLPIELTSKAVLSDRLFESEILFSLSETDLYNTIDSYFGANVVAGKGDNNKMLVFESANIQALYEGVNPAVDNDYRKNLWITPVVDSDSLLVSCKYTSQNQLPLIRVSELYYIASECSEDETNGLAYLNKLRASRGLSALEGEINLQDEIVKEYEKEFLLEGQTFFCYKRLNMNQIGVNYSVSGVDDAIYKMPLPEKEIDYGQVED